VLRANVIENGASRRLELACSEGFLQALPGKVTILADAALDRDEVYAAQARTDLAAAQDELKADGGDLTAHRSARTKIDFANAKLSVAGV